ncbi:MAG TPA: tetratricopeptide repeat protein [Dokdonella sp.]|uniref:tetratricopeptide repeat protein n=1 Tax=Dokdonella sp. TaxID=2291710 RepID=UPI002D80EDFC|nr:tetratricopeptide repeat protein [Dokdonella sp.]HET9033060.1 tetratricopeptide repeat protein [Dokdonella sp.]
MKITLRKLRPFVLFVFSALLMACSNPTPKQAPSVVRPDTDRIAAVKAIRAAGAGDDSALQVNPLRDPAVEGFLAKAEQAEQLQRLDDAHVAIQKAQALAPDAPDILQKEAEIEFLRGNIIEAEKLAYESFKKGPQVGTLCVQNWQTIIEARKSFGDNDYLPHAEKRRKECTVKRPVRL